MGIGRLNTEVAKLYARLKTNAPPGAEPVIKFGRNYDIDTGNEDVVAQGGVYPFLAAAEPLRLWSSDAQDNNTTGTGTWTSEMHGLTTGFVRQTATYTHNGATTHGTGVLTAEDWLRVHYWKGLTAGTAGWNVGNLSAAPTSDSAKVVGYMAATKGRTQQAVYTVEAGKVFLMEYAFAVMTRDAGGGAAAQVEIDFYERDASIANPHWREAFDLNLQITGSGGLGLLSPNVRYRFEEKHDLRAYVPTVTDANTGVAVIYAGYLVDP